MTDLIPLNTMHKITIPTLFIHGKNDTLVLPENSEKLFEKSSVMQKELYLFNGTHNSPRHIDGAFDKCF
jgi:dipeptidyl aminopeptidase/acylaminoacyl peptidase